MKRLVTLASLLFCISVFNTGCSTTNTQAKLLASTVLTVDAAVKGWHSFVVAGGGSQEQDAKVQLAYIKYQAFEALAEKALITSMQTGDKTFYTQANIQLQAAQKEILDLVTLFKK